MWGSAYGCCCCCDDLGYFSELYESPLYNPEKGKIGGGLFGNDYFEPSTFIANISSMTDSNEIVIEYKKRIRRLPYRYHSDHKHLMYQGVFHPCKSPQAIEMLGAAKPWLWWTYPITDFSWKWFQIRKQLPHYNTYWWESIFTITILFKIIFPPIAILLAFRKFKMTLSSPSSNSINNNNEGGLSLPSLPSSNDLQTLLSHSNSSMPSFFKNSIVKKIFPVKYFQRQSYTLLCILIGIIILYCSVNFADNMTPHHLDPYTSWLIFGEWFMLSSVLLCTLGCHLIFYLSQHSSLIKYSVYAIQSATFSSLHDGVSGDEDDGTSIVAHAMGMLPTTVKNWAIITIGWMAFSVNLLSELNRFVSVRIVGKAVYAVIFLSIFIALYLMGFYKINKIWSLKKHSR